MVVTVLLLAACGGPERDVESTEVALSQLEQDLLDRYALDRASASYDRSTGVALPSLISVQVTATTDDEAAITELIRWIARDAWTSDIPEISRLTVRIRPQGAGARYDTGAVFGTLTVPAASLEDEFGPRPSS